MASELVNSATSDKLSEVDWAKNIEICELVARDHRYNLWDTFSLFLSEMNTYNVYLWFWFILIFAYLFSTGLLMK